MSEMLLKVIIMYLFHGESVSSVSIWR